MDYEEALLQVTDVLKAHNRYHMKTPDHEQAVKAIRDIVTPKGKWLPKGRWHIDPQCIEYTCSICDRRIISEERLNVIEQYPFCHCGADMRGDV